MAKKSRETFFKRQRELARKAKRDAKRERKRESKLKKNEDPEAEQPFVPTDVPPSEDVNGLP